MLNSLLYTHPRPLLILQRPQSERERTRLLLNLTENLPARLHLQLIIHLGVSLVNRRPALLGLGLAIRSARDKHINSPNLALLKRLGLMIPSLLRRGVQDDPLLSIRDVLFVGTREHALDGNTSVVLGDGLDDIGDAKVFEGGFDRSHGDLAGFPCGLEGVGGSAFDGLG